jgi:hypothetical protein
MGSWVLYGLGSESKNLPGRHRCQGFLLQLDQLYPLHGFFRSVNFGWQPRPIREINDTKLRNRDSTGIGGNPNLAATRAHEPPGSRRNTLRLDFCAVSLKIFLTLRRVKQKRRRQL